MITADMISPVFNELRTDAIELDLADLKEQIDRKKLLMTKLVSALDELEYSIVSSVYGIDCKSLTFKQIAKRNKLSTEHIEEMHGNAISKLSTSNVLSPAEIVDLIHLTETITIDETELDMLNDANYQHESVSTNPIINQLSKFITDSSIIDSIRNLELSSMTKHLELVL